MRSRESARIRPARGRATVSLARSRRPAVAGEGAGPCSRSARHVRAWGRDGVAHPPARADPRYHGLLRLSAAGGRPRRGGPSERRGLVPVSVPMAASLQSWIDRIPDPSGKGFVLHRPRTGGYGRYCVSPTFSSQSPTFPSRSSWMAMCVIAVVGMAACQCLAPCGSLSASAAA